MQTDETITINSPQATGRPKQIASWWHLIGFLAIIAGVAGMGFYAQHAASGGNGTAGGGQLADHGKTAYVYFVAGIMDWALLYYCWAGAHRFGGNLKTLSGGRWKSWTDLAADVGITLPFWVLWEATAYSVHKVLGPSAAKSVASLLPRSLPEIMLWIAISITAGICEETAFRGYLQRQLHALSGSIGAAVVAQALIFGLAHGYQGWKPVIVISVLGILYGALAAWRRNLRANMMAHAWSDIWEGWLKAMV